MQAKKTNRKGLIEILKAVSPGLAAKEIVEQSTSFIFQDSSVATYNDAVTVSHPVPEEMKSITGVVRAEELLAILSKMKDAEVSVSAGEKELTIAGKRSRASIPLSKETNPQLRQALIEMGKKKQWSRLPDEFADAVKLSLFSAGRDMTRPELAAVHVTGEGVESCDNYRLSRIKYPKLGGESNFLLPVAAAQGLPAHGPGAYVVTGSWAHFRNPKTGAVFSCRTVGGTYPDLEKYLKQRGRSITLPKDLSTVLECAAVFTDKEDPQVEVNINGGVITVKGSNAAGRFEESVKLIPVYEGDAVRFRINPQFLRDILAVTKEAEVTASMLKFQGDGFVHCCSIELVEGK